MLYGMGDTGDNFSWFDYTTWDAANGPFAKTVNGVVYGKLPLPPVPIPGAPQTTYDMTSGTWNPGNANDSMWSKYQSDVNAWSDNASAILGGSSAGQWGTYLLFGIGGLFLYMMLTEGRRR
jgi:hypothetical protein